MHGNLKPQGLGSCCFSWGCVLLIFVDAFMPEERARKQSTNVGALSYLNEIPEISWYEVEGNDVYIGFSSKPNDLYSSSREWRSKEIMRRTSAFTFGQLTPTVVDGAPKTAREHTARSPRGMGRSNSRSGGRPVKAEQKLGHPSLVHRVRCDSPERLVSSSQP